MSKYSKEFKLEVVKYYFDTQQGYRLTADHFNISSKTTVKRWVKKYEEHGLKGLIKNEKTSYSGLFKEKVIKFMYENNLSMQETAIHFNLGDTSVVSNWNKIYKEKGLQELYNKNCKKNKNMNFNLSKDNKKENQKKKEQELLEEIEQLKMENMYLKKLQALVQKRTKPKRQKK